MNKVYVFIGTRPEAIKLAPLVAVLRASGTHLVRVVSTGQHREMLAQMLSEFGIAADIELGLMSRSQTLSGLSALLFQHVGNLVRRDHPDLVVVQGDTTTAMVAAVCAFYEGIPVAHIEAGLRSGNLQAPFPEEANRRIISLVASLHFAPTELAADHLLGEGVRPTMVHVTGNTAIDAVLLMQKQLQGRDTGLPARLADLISSGKRFILITGHRRESFGGGFERICHAVRRLATAFPEINFVYPVHLNPQVREPVMALLSGLDNVLLEEPLGYSQFVLVMSRCYLILTDSGGIQEEGPALDKPVLVMRTVTERQEGVANGCARLVGVDSDAIVVGVTELIMDSAAYDSMAKAPNPYGDGQASHKVVAVIDQFFNVATS